MSSIELRHVSKTYENKTTVIEGMNLTIEDGSFTVLVGPSGCGKTTTLRMIAGLEEISSGDLLIDGVRMNDAEPGERNIAMVFQNYALYPTMSVRENMEFGLVNAKVPKEERDRRIKEFSHIVGLEKYLDRKPSQLSGGQRQRVAIARALSLQPDVIIADEPTSALDVSVRAQILNLLTDLKKELGLAMVFISHDIQTERYISDRIVVMNHGQIMEEGPAKQVFEDPQDAYTKTLLAAAPSLLHPNLGQ